VFVSIRFLDADHLSSADPEHKVGYTEHAASERFDCRYYQVDSEERDGKASCSVRATSKSFGWHTDSGID
jgi:hypothetical protein